MRSSSRDYPDINQYIKSVERKDDRPIDVSVHVREFFKFHESRKELTKKNLG